MKKLGTLLWSKIKSERGFKPFRNIRIPLNRGEIGIELPILETFLKQGMELSNQVGLKERIIIPEFLKP